MRRLFFLILIPFFLNAYVMEFDPQGNFEGFYSIDSVLGNFNSCNDSLSFIINGVGYQATWVDPSGWNTLCIKRNYKKLSGLECGGGSWSEYFYKFNSDFCKSKKGYIYDVNANAWLPTLNNRGAPPICPQGYEFSSKQGKCISLNDCSSGLTLYKGECITPNQLLKQILTSQDYQYFQNNCHFVNHSITVNNKDLCTADLYCGGKYLRSIQVSCGKVVKSTDNNSSNNSSISNKPLVCGPDQTILITGNKVSCVDDNITIPKVSKVSNVHNDSSSNSSNNVITGSNKKNQSNQADFNNTSDNINGSNSSSSIDCCERYKNPQFGDSWVSVSPGVWKLSGGSCEVTIKDGNCSIVTSIDSNSSNSSGLLNSISSKISDTNSKLNNIDKDVKDLINAKPSTQPSSQLSSDTKSFLSGFSETISNTKNIISNLKSSSNEVIQLLQNPKKVTLFSNTNIQTCPVDFKLYGQIHSFDICKIVSPYRPIVQLTFTIFFSISVLLYFLDVVIRSK